MFSFRRRRRNIKRLARIAQVAVKHGFGYFLEKFELVPPGRKKHQPLEREKAGQRLRLLLEDLGPTFVKIGQLLSVRPDLIPPDIIFELEKLQDRVPPFSYDEVREIFRKDFEKEIDEVFTRFEVQPVASASIGQVHLAYLEDGQKVAVKVQRPGARELIEADIDLLFFVANRVRERVGFIDVLGLTQEMADSLQRELDYRIEARHIDRFRHNFRDDALIKIPLVYWPYTSRRVLTMECIDGTKVSDLATPEKLGINTYDLAVHGARAFMKQVLEDGFFHGDLHPANILITPDGKIAYLDFGIVGRVSEEDRETIAQILMGIIRQDADLIVEKLADLGVKVSRERVPQMREELRDIIDHYYGRTLGEVQIDVIGREFLSLIYRHKIRIPKDYALLVKALVTIEGVAKKLYPQINILEVARPYVTQLIRQKYGPTRLLKHWLEESEIYAWQLIDLTRQIHAVLSSLRRGEFQIRYQHQGLEKVSDSIKQSSKLVAMVFLFGALVLALPLFIYLSSFSTIYIFLGFIILGLFLLIFYFILRS